MAMARSLIRNSAACQSPGAALMEVNQTIIAQCSSVMFVSVFFAMLDPKKYTLRYANAGHNPPIVRRASGSIEQLPHTGRVVGAFENLHLGEATMDGRLRSGLAVSALPATPCLWQ
jgi:sigma-B regulation protein RsbU (phosphoserine phosphatase)